MADSESSKNVPSKLPQYISSAIAGLSGFASGVALCPLVIDSSYNEYVSLEEHGHLSYFHMFGGIVGTLISGLISDYVGPKRAIQISAFPLFMSRLITAYCRTVYGFYAAMLLHGFATAITVFSTINYCRDIADRRQRGSVAFMYYAQLLLGSICAYCIDRNVDDFILQALIPSVVPVIYLTALSFIPESPVHLCMNDDLLQACSSLQWLRGADYDIDDEMARMREYTRAKNHHHRHESSGEVFERFASRKTAILIFNADALFAVLYILYSRNVTRLSSFNLLLDAQWVLISRHNELMFPMVLLLMWMVKHVELSKLIQLSFLISACGTMLVEVALYIFEDVRWMWIPCLINVIISHGNVLMVTLLMWQIFDNIVLKSKAIPLCLIMEYFWNVTYTTMPNYQIPSIYLTTVNVFIGIVLIKYVLANVLTQKQPLTKIIFLQNIA